MKIIICGAGRVGQAIARHLEREDASIVFVDIDEDRLDRVATELKISDIIMGNACDPDVLTKAGAKDCEILVAVTPNDETNFVICHIAKAIFGTESTIARMRGEHYTKYIGEKVFKDVVDVVIQPEIDVAKAIVRNLDMPETKFYCELADEELKVIALKLGCTEKFAPSRLKTLNEDLKDLGVAVLGFVRPDYEKLEFLKFSELPQSDQDGDGDTEYKVYFAVKSSNFDKFIAEFAEQQKESGRVLIVGGGHIGYNIAKELERNKSFSTRLIELDSDVASQIAERLNRTSVLNGDGLDRKILDEAKVADTDFVLATTSDDKTNIMICLFAEHLEAKHSFAMINDRNLKSFSESTDIDTVVSLRLQTLSKVIDSIRGKNIHNTRVIEDGRAEILEGIVRNKSNIYDEEIDENYFDKQIRLVAVVRQVEEIDASEGVKSKIFLPSAETKIKMAENDRVILLCLHDKETVKKAERLFSLKPTAA